MRFNQNMFENYRKLNFKKVTEFLLFIYLLSHAATAATAAFLRPQCATAQNGRRPRRRWQHGVTAHGGRQRFKIIVGETEFQEKI